MPAAPASSREREVDEVTLRLAIRGDRAAKDRLVACYAPMLFRFLGRLRGSSSEPLDDLAQEAMLQVLLSLPRFDPGGTARLSTWVLTIASRVASTARRKARPTDPLPELSVSTGSPERNAAARQTVRRVSVALEGVAPELREAFILAAAHGLTAKEIAVVQDIKPATARTRLHRARTELRRALDQEGSQ